MACEICGRGSCTRSFHSLEAQERHDAIQKADPEEMFDRIAALERERQQAARKEKTIEHTPEIADFVRDMEAA